MRINITSVFVNDQEKALQFYTRVLGFAKTCGNLIQIVQAQSND